MKTLLLFCLLALWINAHAQVAINTDGSLPDNSAMLDVQSTSRGFLPPRVSLTSINSPDPITSPAAGLLVFNTAYAGYQPNDVTPGYYFWNGYRWVPIVAPNGYNPGDMLYWNGSQWIRLAAGAYGNHLVFCDGFPAWGGCLPLLTTREAYSVTATSAISGGFVTNDGGQTLWNFGVCYNTASNPTLANSVVNATGGAGSYICELTGLTPGNTYYVRAWATNSTGTTYGNQVSFIAQNAVISLATLPVSIILAAGATSGGNITSDGGAAVTARGICWSNTPGPSIAGNKTTNGTGTGSFVSNMYGMSPGTPYFVRAYATNSSGTCYGNELGFTTTDGFCPGNSSAVNYGGMTYHTILIGTQCWLRENLNIGSRIAMAVNQTNNSTIEKYCLYELESYCNIYGGLYQWDELMQYTTTQGVKGICPEGWHIPTDVEYATLASFLGGDNVAGGKMKESGPAHWLYPGGINSSLFTALPGGARSWDGFGSNPGYDGTFWSSTQSDASNAWKRNLDGNDDITNSAVTKLVGYSVRCLRD